MHGLNFEVLWKGVVGRDAEVKILNPTATIVGTAHPDEHTFSISFRDRTDRQDYFGEIFLKVFATHNSRLPALAFKKISGILLLLASFSFCFLMERPPTIE